jgi:hypothetical protein
MAADYDPGDDETPRFFRVIQNKLHFAATGQTAAELIRSRAKAELPNMGSVSKTDADKHAAGQYEEFSVRRREYKEIHGARDYLRQLEDIAQKGGSGDE